MPAASHSRAAWPNSPVALSRSPLRAASPACNRRATAPGPPGLLPSPTPASAAPLAEQVRPPRPRRPRRCVRKIRTCCTRTVASVRHRASLAGTAARPRGRALVQVDLHVVEQAVHVLDVEALLRPASHQRGQLLGAPLRLVGRQAQRTSAPPGTGSSPRTGRRARGPA